MKSFKEFINEAKTSEKPDYKASGTKVKLFGKNVEIWRALDKSGEVVQVFTTKDECETWAKKNGNLVESVLDEAINESFVVMSLDEYVSASEALVEGQNTLSKQAAMKALWDAGFNTEDLIKKAEEALGKLKPAENKFWYATDIQKIIDMETQHKTV